MPISEDVDKILAQISHYYKKRYDKDPKETADIIHHLTYDSPTEALEPVYFWVTNFLIDKGIDKNPEKLIDNFASAPGSGHFSELGGKKSAMQEQASKLLATINTILRSVLNLIYDLKEFKIRLSHYNAANSKDPNLKEAGILSLKQIWLDKVDIQRGQGSINALASGNLQFVTLRDAFYISKNPEDVDKMDLNERVKRLLKPRILEFLEWKKRSEQELKKRFELEKSYLKSQVASLKLQAKWARPYLLAAKKLEQNENLEASYALVTAFNTVLLQVTILGKSEISIPKTKHTPDRYGGRQYPEDFSKITQKKKIRKYYYVLIVDFNFIGIPSKAGQHYVFGGKADMHFKSYSLNEEEINLLKYKLNEQDLENALGLVEGMTKDSLEALQLDIDEFLDDDKEEKEKPIDVNPFSAIFSAFKSSKKPTPKTKEEEKEVHNKKMKALAKTGIKKDSYIEAYVRNVAIAKAMDVGFGIYDNFKKNMGMASFPFGGKMGTSRGIAKAPKSRPEEWFNFPDSAGGSSI
ncbi:MAG: hypothetical protein ABIH37_03815 [archaeon]